MSPKIDEEKKSKLEQLNEEIDEVTYKIENPDSDVVATGYDLITEKEHLIEKRNELIEKLIQRNKYNIEYEQPRISSRLRGRGK